MPMNLMGNRPKGAGRKALDEREWPFQLNGESQGDASAGQPSYSR
jgi:hypothetical protein